MQRTFMLDTSCMVALLLPGHAHHERTTAVAERKLARGDELVSGAHALVECYSVLTRLPGARRISPSAAHELITRNFTEGRRVVSLGVRATKSMLFDLAQRSIGGGAAYDALIATTAIGANVDEILTLNAKHFESFASDRLAIVVPD